MKQSKRSKKEARQVLFHFLIESRKQKKRLAAELTLASRFPRRKTKALYVGHWTADAISFFCDNFFMSTANAATTS